MPNIIDSIQISSSTFDVRDKSATTVVNLTQEQYDNLPSSAKTANVLYNITDATAVDLSQYWTSAQTQSAITQATSGLQETLSAGTGIDITDNVISATGGGITSGEVQSMIDDSISGKADASAVTQDIAAAVSGKLDTSTFETFSGNVETALSGKQDTLSAGTGIQISGNVISATGGSSSGGTDVVEMTQAEYDAAASAGTLDAETLYIITDAEEINANDYVTKASNVSSGLTVTIEKTGTNNNLVQVKDVYISADTNCTRVGVYFNSNYFGTSINFDFQTIPSFGYDYMMVDFDSENRTYHVWSTDTNLFFYYVYAYDYEGSETFKLWVYTWQIPSGQTASVLNNALPEIASVIDDAKNTLVENINFTTSTGGKNYWVYNIKKGGTENGYSFQVCDGKEIVNDNGLKLGNISTQTVYSSELLSASTCTYTPLGNSWISNYSEAIQYFFLKFNHNFYDNTQFQLEIYYYFNSGGNSTSKYIYVMLNNGTIEVNLGDGNWSSDYSALTSSIQNDTSLDITITSDGIEYVKGSGGTEWISHIYCGNCLCYGSDHQDSPFSSMTEFHNSIGIYEAVETLFGNYEDGKYVESSAVTSAVTSGSTDDEIPTAKAVYDALGGGGGKAIEAGRGISITTGETADTVSFNLPISAGTGSDSIFGGYFGNKSLAQYGFAFGDNAKCMNSGSACMAFGSNVTANANAAFVTGYYNEGTNQSQAVFGRYSVNNKANGTFGDSGNTLFSVGNGTSSARHNAFEIRQNGDIYLSSGGTDIKLQDHLGGGGITSGEVQSMIDSSISGKTDESAFTAHTSDATIHVTTAQTASWNGAVSDIATVSAATASNTTALGGLKLVKLTQAEYDVLATKDSNTLYVIVN